MNAVIKPGDRVSVVERKRIYKGFSVSKYTATVVKWTDGGLLQIKPDNAKKSKSVSAENVKKIADAKPTEQ